jgi:hypothetical protein
MLGTQKGHVKRLWTLKGGTYQSLEMLPLEGLSDYLSQ